MKLRPNRLRGFYSVLDEPSSSLALALLRHSKVMQVRKKPSTPMELRAIGRVARAMTARLGALFVVNDDIELAHHLGADAVHLGQDDTPLTTARRRTDLILGVSTHNLEQLRAALGDGADYVAFGPVFATSTKANPDPTVGLDALREAAKLAGAVPLVAIGGITPGNAPSVRAAGADAACVISAVNRARSVSAAANSIARAFQTT